jgi:biopolymer transport protein ExbD
MNWIVRLDVIVLALMLVYVVVVVAHVFCRCHLARRARQIDSASRSKLAAVLRIELGGLKAIASSAPYLGLAGTCVGLMSALVFSGGNTSLATEAAKMAAPLITTATGILVAVPATCAYDYLCTRKDLLESELPNDPDQMSRYRQGTRRLALKKRFSQLPAFAIIAASVLAALVAVYTPYFAPREAAGLELELAPSCCENCANDRVTLLHITDAGKLFLNAEQIDWNGLAGRLSELYRVREERTLDLVADDGASFQTVADALDIVENIPATAGPQATGKEMDKLDITVRLVTPGVWNARCLGPVATRTSHRVSK